MIKKIPLIFIVLIIITLIFVFIPKEQSEKGITVFMAASTTNIVEELAAIYTEESGVKVFLNSASSGILAKQINNGANADIYISASKKWVDNIESHLLRSNAFVKNRLVLIAPKGLNNKSFNVNTDILSFFNGKLSIGDPDHVPAGVYAKNVLDFYDWYNALSSRLLLGADVRGALSVVEMGEAELGIVYKTDAMQSNKVDILYVFPEESHGPIEYYCGELKGSNKYKSDFYNFLLENNKAKELYSKYGFSIGE